MYQISNLKCVQTSKQLNIPRVSKFSNSKMEAKVMQNLLQNSVEITVNVEESRLADYQKLSEDYGVLQFSISKPLKFEDLGLAALEDGQFQCLACSKIFKGKFSKGNSAAHFKKFHTDRPVESKVQCPRCPEEMAKSTLNSHMEQKHQLKNFNQLLKRSFIVSNAQGSVQEPAYASENIVAKRKLPKSTRFKHLYNDPLSLGKLGDFSNNNANIKEEFNIIQE